MRMGASEWEMLKMNQSDWMRQDEWVTLGTRKSRHRSEGDIGGGGTMKQQWDPASSVPLGLKIFHLYLRITFKDRWNHMKNNHLGPQNLDLYWWGAFKSEAVIAGLHCSSKQECSSNNYFTLSYCLLGHQICRTLVRWWKSQKIQLSYAAGLS